MDRGFEDYLFGEELDFPSETIGAGSTESVASVWDLTGCKEANLKSADAVVAKPNDDRYRQLFSVVDDLSGTSGLSRPKDYVLPNKDIHASAAGKAPEHNVIASLKI